MIPFKDDKSFIMADIPGIIEGAADGKGLGIRFLRHIERNSVLLFMIPVNSKIEEEYKLLYNELKRYNPEMLNKNIVIAITKCDLMSEDELKELKINLKEDIVLISSITNYNLEELKNILWNNLNKN